MRQGDQFVRRSCEGEPLLTAKEVEAILKIDVKTIYNYVQRGLIPYVRIQSNVRFVRSHIVEWISGHSYEPKKRRPS
jgi:predicted DNA-binding transcriptional regulator AlpA